MVSTEKSALGRRVLRTALLRSFTAIDIHTLYKFAGRRFREKRLRVFKDLLSANPHTTIVDIGGRYPTWEGFEVNGQHPKLLVLVNLPDNFVFEHPSWMYAVIADGRALPFRDEAFEFAFSNSVIEHVGARRDQEQFAHEAARVGKNYFIQTPNKAFPFEPHYLTPFIHWLPRALQARLLRNFSVWGIMVRPTRTECRDIVNEIRLLSERDMRSLLPDAQILREGVLGLVKSFTAVRIRPKESKL